MHAPAAPVLWHTPVPGPVVRAFSYGAADPFARGWHRGADLRAAPGATVRAACGGRVVTALAGAVVTLRCGPWRVTHLPMADVSVRAGRRVAPGARLGTLGTSRAHGGLHLGVRRAGDAFGYVDPLPFLRAARPPLSIPPPLAHLPRRTPPLRASPPPAARLRRAPPPPAARLRRTPPLRASPPSSPRLARPLRAPPLVPSSPLAAPLPARHPAGVRVPLGGGPAPWPVWMGLALVLFGACGGGVRWRLRARRVRARARVREAVR